ARVLVTGATGFIGWHLCRQLAELGATVYGLSRSASPATVPTGVIPMAADVTQRAEIVAAMERVRPSHVLHLAAAGVTDPFLPMEQAVEVNVSGTINVLEASYEVGVQRFVQVGTAYEQSASEPDRGPNNPYVASKLAAWLFWRAYIEKNAIDSVAVRLFHVYGPQQLRGLIPAAMQAALRHETFNMTPGEQLRDFVYIDDVVTGLVACVSSADNAGKTYDLGTGTARSIRAAVQYIFAVTDSRGAVAAGMQPYRPSESMALMAETESIYRAYGWRARVPFETGIQITLQWYQRQGFTN
ncbi:MAG TPA: NAD-dependent epimerase/dehydratase family protein, partial [Anaerolineae bacterium]|nr:NAD-dependent epimerase/dehydratase family protein [Anaerolineae bacterium]